MVMAPGQDLRGLQMLGEWNCSVFRCCHCHVKKKHVSPKKQPTFYRKAFQSQEDTQGPCTRP